MFSLHHDFFSEILYFTVYYFSFRHNYISTAPNQIVIIEVRFRRQLEYYLFLNAGLFNVNSLLLLLKDKAENLTNVRQFCEQRYTFSILF